MLKNVKSVDEFFHIKLYRTDEANRDPKSLSNFLAYRKICIRDIVSSEDFEEKGKSKVNKWFQLVNQRNHKCAEHAGLIRIKAEIDNP